MKTEKKKIAFVNVLFPPNALGGATRVLVDEISLLQEKYGDKYEIVVFTANFDESNLYKLTIYPLEGYRVYSISCVLNVESNWSAQDEQVRKVFDEFLLFEKPDLVHFHCVQVLTASVVAAAQARNIPTVITIHDAWWLSDHQFLVDQDGHVYPNGHPDPFQKVTLPKWVTTDQSLKRRGFLKSILLKSDVVLAVSETFSNLYKNNGVFNIQVNKNGISDNVPWVGKNTNFTDKVVCAHIGGMSHHKGFSVFKSAAEKVTSSNIEVLVVDHSKGAGYINHGCWGDVPVKTIGHIAQDLVFELYGAIDVLFAPSVCPESFGLVTREAAACGCWVVASNVGAIGEDITPSNGFIVPPTEAGLHTVFSEIIKNPKKYKGLSTSENIRYSSDQVEELHSLFNGLLSNTHL